MPPPVALAQVRELQLPPMRRPPLDTSHEVTDGNMRRDFHEHMDRADSGHVGVVTLPSFTCQESKCAAEAGNQLFTPVVATVNSIRPVRNRESGDASTDGKHAQTGLTIPTKRMADIIGLAGDNRLDRFGIEDRIWRKVTSCRASQQMGRDCRHDHPNRAAARPISRGFGSSRCYHPAICSGNGAEDDPGEEDPPI